MSLTHPSVPQSVRKTIVFFTLLLVICANIEGRLWIIKVWNSWNNFFILFAELEWTAMATTDGVWITTECRSDTATSVAPCPWSSVRTWSRGQRSRSSSSSPESSAQRWVVGRGVGVPTGITAIALVRSSASDVRLVLVPSVDPSPVDVWGITSDGRKSGIWRKRNLNSIRQVRAKNFV